VGLQDLLKRPTSEREQRDWDWSHRQHTELVRQAVQAQTKPSLNLPIYQLEPVDWAKPRYFLELNATSHQDINGALGLPGVDLETVDLTNPGQRDAWYELHYMEHQQWSFRLKV